MPATYASTAEALSVSPTPPSDDPISPIASPTLPLWSRPRSSISRGRRSSSVFSAAASAGFRDRAINRARRTYERLLASFMRLTPLQRLGAVLAWLFFMALSIAFAIFTGKLFRWLEAVADKWEKKPLAYFVVWMCTFVVSFPPMLGWSTAGTVAGYLFGVWKGWLVYGTASVVGSTCSFIVSRTILSGFVQRLVSHDKRFTALSLILKYDGLKLLCMIRLCPLPYSICNGAISTFPTVQPLMYGLATAIISPKFLISVFIGSRLRILSGDEMSPGAKALNIISVIIGIFIGVFTGWYIYKRTLARAAELEAEERGNIRHSVDAGGHLPPPGSFTDNPDDAAAAALLGQDEEGRIGFHDDDAVEVDDDHVAIDTRGYRDEFTDNDSDVFDAGDGDDERAEEAYSLHRHVETK